MTRPPVSQQVIVPLLLATLSVGCSSQVGEPTAPKATPLPTLTPTRISRPTTDAEKGRALASAVDLTRSQRCHEAIPLLRVLLDAYPEMADYHLYHLALCAEAKGDANAAMQARLQLVKDHARSVFAEEAALGVGRHQHATGDTGAELWLRRASNSEQKKIAQEARLILAEIDLANKNVRSSYAVFSALREDAVGTDVGNRAKGYAMALRERYPELQPTGDNRRAEARLLMREGDFDAALRLCAALLATTEERGRPEILLLRAEIEKASGSIDRHLETLRSVHRSYPQSPNAPQALYEEARWLWNKDSDENAKKAFLELRQRYPRHPRTASAHYALARIAQTAGDDATAIAGFREVIKRYPRGRFGAESRRQIPWIHYRNQQWSNAAKEFSKLAGHSSVKRNPGDAYWRARSLERAGRSAEARTQYDLILERAPDSYYAGLAAERLGRRSNFAADKVVAEAAPFPQLQVAQLQDYHLSRARQLHAAGLFDLARREVRAYSRTEQALPRATMIKLYRAVDGHRQAIRLAGSNRDRYGDILYPLAFWGHTKNSANRYQVDPLLALSLMRQESLFDPEARSPANARGLMQLLPSTAEAVAGRIGRGGGIDLYDPATNIELGTAHLRELADRYNGDHVRILAAYNAGAAAVAKWDRRFGDLPPDEYVESITYRETRDYVKKVLGNYRRYQRMYGGG